MQPFGQDVLADFRVGRIAQERNPDGPDDPDRGLRVRRDEVCREYQADNYTENKSTHHAHTLLLLVRLSPRSNVVPNLLACLISQDCEVIGRMEAHCFQPLSGNAHGSDVASCLKAPLFDEFSRGAVRVPACELFE